MGVHVERDGLTIEGESNVKVITSSAWAERAFCSNCGSNLWYRVTEGPYASGVSLSLGMFDDTSGLTLSHEYYVDRVRDAYEFPEDRMKMTEAEVIAMFAPAEDGEAK